MAAIGKIRSWGTFLVVVLGIVLLFFILEYAGEALRTITATNSQTIGKVMGEKVYYQDYQALVDEYQEVLKMQGYDDLNEDQMNNVRDMVWQNYVTSKLIEAEADKLGLMVTDEEVANILREGTNPILYQLPLSPQFFNQQTRQFDYSIVTTQYEQLKQLAAQDARYQEQYATFDRYWKYVEKQLRQQLLQSKYQSLLAGCVMSNPVAAKAAFENQTQESSILLAALPYNSVNDNEVTVSDADLKAKYNEKKEMFRQDVETRDIKYIPVHVKASEGDRKQLIDIMKGCVADFKSDSINASEIVRRAQSKISYNGLPVTRQALPGDIAAHLDSMSVGQVSQPFETTSDNTFNVVKYISKVQQPDSIEVRSIFLASEASADSVLKALRGGAQFDSIASRYNQPGTKSWFTSANYQSAPTIDADTKNYVEALLSMQRGELKSLKISQGNIVFEVTDRRAIVDKYNVAIVKRDINFSNETYNEAFNKFSQFISENTSIEAMEENAAKNGYNVMSRANVTNAVHTIAGICGTHDALKWVFDAKPGAISQLYDRCGDNDYMLVVALDKIHEKGYADFETVKDMLKQEVINDKKFDLLAKKFEGVKSIADARKQNARVDTVRFITFSSPVFVPSTTASEPALNGAVVATEKGKISRVVKGKAGAYMFQVIDRKQRDGAKFDEKQMQIQLRQQGMPNVQMLLQDLYEKANVEDNRYLFF
ncbi:SurA N-terminal domain-containing protein [Prevotella sp. E13-17]|uniref:peptidylprolyl isomerase n=1 Tax=Prevotella sp. E13-17 TaxID=2913616 RepID=UPI001EDB16EF|nr:peptidylprolyl isomerase [Prevotella sp. E13-17]UKK49869.1 SurA N-terminal domain-containing protein [Prevotella sp. E13-17]